MDREALRRQVSDLLGDRRVVWSGLRGEDAEPLADLPQMYASYSMLSAYRRRAGIEGAAYEDLTGTRPDLEVYDIDDHPGEPAVHTFRRLHLRALDAPSVLVPYRPSPFLSAVGFARRDRCKVLGLFGGQQAAFDHKPWVETSLADLGVATVPWTYVADEEQLRLDSRLDQGPLVLRQSRTSGGVGFRVVREREELVATGLDLREGFVSVAPLLEGIVPLNIGGTVWSDGVTLHHPSLQLVGIPSCTTRPFGYCGNDFGAIRSLPTELIDDLAETTTRIGAWLRLQGYLGTFGVDYLLHQGQLLFTEVNPRFQGSTTASCRLAIEADQSCLLLEHVAAHLGLPAPPSPPLRELVASTTPLSQVVVHSTADAPVNVGVDALREDLAEAAGGGSIVLDVCTRADLATEPGAVACRITARQEVTTTGFDLPPAWDEALARWQQQHAGAAGGGSTCR